MKFKDYFLKLKEQGEINNEDFNKFIESAPDGEIPDNVFTLLDSTFLTTKRALTHRDVAGKIKADTLSPVDREIASLLKYLPPERVIEIERETSTFKKLELLREAVPEALQKAGKAPNDEESKKKIQEKEQIIHDLTEKFNKLNESHKSEIQKAKESAQADLHNYKKRSELEKLANSYTFADVFKDARPTLTKAILSEIEASNKIDLSEKEGGYTFSVLDETGAPRFENNGNTPVTINSILDKAFKPYLKVSNAEPEKPKVQTFTVETQGGQPRRGANVAVQD